MAKGAEKLEDEYFLLLNNNHYGRVVVVIDCDNRTERIKDALDRVPEKIKDRVFIIGTLDEPEALKKDLSMSLEAIGGEVAEDCGKENAPIWAAVPGEARFPGGLGHFSADDCFAAASS